LSVACGTVGLARLLPDGITSLIRSCRVRSRPPTLGPAFRARLGRRIRRDIASQWYERLPDIMHVSGGGVVVAVRAVIVPADLPMTGVVGMLGILLMYAAINVARGWLEDVEYT
jgi:hypothetical protein